MPAGLLGPAAVCYQGHLYVVGGYDAGVHYDTLHIYDIAKDTWSQGSSLSNGIYFAALGAWDGKLYLVGGTASYDPWPPLDHVNIYDIAAGSWSEQAGAPMP
jgi:N-acetylneuraminic acid mutarotase